jgi:L-threonylcarbamoyladenylate synthase
MHPKITKDIQLATSALKAGMLVSFPTETVYGLGADATDDAAINKVFVAKGRPADHPLILHLAAANLLSNIAIEIPTYAYALADTFWPGPLTLVLKKHPTVSALITGGQDTVAVRIPKHQQALELLQHFPRGLVGPSANRFGKISPTCALHVIDDLRAASELALVLDGGSCNIGIESTIVDCSATAPRILRHGHISAELIETTLNIKLSQHSNHMRISGHLKSHYAPSASAILANYTQILQIIAQMPTAKIAVLSTSANPDLKTNALWLVEKHEPQIYAKNLYANLRMLDQGVPDYILIEATPTNSQWHGINDRLKKATSSYSIAMLFAKTFAHD